jgi:hypothetical protein
MPEIRTISFTFPRTEGSGPQTASQSVRFPRDVVNAAVGITGYSIGFSGDDHHVGRMEVAIESEVTGQAVQVNARLGLRDWSGNWDDPYEGWITAAVIAELALISPPLPRAEDGTPETKPPAVISVSTEPVDWTTGVDDAADR